MTWEKIPSRTDALWKEIARTRSFAHLRFETVAWGAPYALFGVAGWKIESWIGGRHGGICPPHRAQPFDANTRSAYGASVLGAGSRRGVMTLRTYGKH